jgi:hypothetical protein
LPRLFLNTRPGSAEADAFKGYNEESTQSRREYRRLIEKSQQERAGCEEPTPELDADEAIQAWQRMIEEPRSDAA